MSEWNEDDPDLGQKTEAEEPQNNIDIAQEDTFYGNQQIYNSRLDDYEKDMNCEYLSEEEREYAKQQYNEVYIEKRDAIDKWKEEHGQYDEERTELRIGENKSEEIKEQESYDIEEQVLEGGFQESQTADIEIAEQEAEAQRQTEMEKELEKKQEKYKDLDLEYKQIKNDIEISRTSEERAYWEKRAEEIWQERDRVGDEIEDYRRERQTEMEKGLEKKQEKYKDLDLEYKQIKNDIEISRSSEERAYWEKRAEEIWQERDRVGGEIENYRRNK